MKASIITLQSVCNYGTQLQAYAAQQKLLQYFDEVEFVNYRRSDTYGKGLLKIYSQGNPVRWLIFLPTYLKWKKVFVDFQKRYLNITSQEYYNDSDFARHPIKADIYFSGSDQVWNTGWNHGIIKPFYLNYAPEDSPKYAFSSSFGQSKIRKEYIPEIKKLLSKYNRISVREQTGVEIIKNQLKLKTDTLRINDPTLSFNGNFWRTLKQTNKIKEKYILIYNLKNSPFLDNYAKKVSQKTGYKLYRFCTRYDQIRKCGKSLLIPSIENFITYIDDAEYVITDSFHATAFCANLNTKSIVIPPKQYSSRLLDFINLIETSRCIVKDTLDYTPVTYNPDFKKINQILERERERIDIFLSQILEEIKHD